MLRRRYASRVSDHVFPAPRSGTVRDRSNTGRSLRSAFARAGFTGLSSHAFRKSVATLMSDAGLSSRDAADQLGHSRPSMTTDVYSVARNAPAAQLPSWKICSTAERCLPPTWPAQTGGAVDRGGSWPSTAERRACRGPREGRIHQGCVRRLAWSAFPYVAGGCIHCQVWMAGRAVTDASALVPNAR